MTKIYVASLADYNDGRLHGTWIDASLGADHISEEVQAMLARSPLQGTIYGPAEEWAIHDYEGFGEIRLSEWESFERVAELAEAIEEHGEAFFAYLSAFGDDAEVDEFEDYYRGEYDSPEDYAAEWHEMVGDVPDRLMNFIDWKAVARDMDCEGYHFERRSGSVFVFIS